MIAVLNTCTPDEAEVILAPYAGAFKDDASRAAIRKLLMADRSAAEGLLAGLPRAAGADCDEARKIVREKHGHFRGDYAREEMVKLLVKDKAAGLALLSGLRELPNPEKFTIPPPPMHDPEGGPTSPEAIAAAGEALIKEIQKEGRFTDYTAARGEARRRNPSLFS